MSDVIDRLRNDRTLRLRDRTSELLAEAPQELVDLIEARRLNWLETPILLTLALADENDWAKGEAGVNELGEVLKRRSADLEDQLVWLRKKGLVEDGQDTGDGQVWWQITDEVDQLLGPVSS